MMSKNPGGHVIVCGFGILGQKVVDVLAEHSIKFVIIEIDPKVVGVIKEYGYEVVEGDATRSRTLRKANIETAKAIAIAMDDDAENLFTVLTARDLNKDIFIAARANDEFVRNKLVEAGADYVVMPQKAASKEIVDELLK
ncbi:MAG: NAD(P)-binding protein [Candidatus Micrarchaeaceae archaeon]